MRAKIVLLTLAMYVILPLFLATHIAKGFGFEGPIPEIDFEAVANKISLVAEVILEG